MNYLTNNETIKEKRWWVVSNLIYFYENNYNIIYIYECGVKSLKKLKRAGNKKVNL